MNSFSQWHLYKAILVPLLDVSTAIYCCLQVGTFNIALAAGSLNKPFYVVAESFKFTRYGHKSVTAHNLVYIMECPLCLVFS
jgi:hypothetical protein